MNGIYLILIMKQYKKKTLFLFELWQHKFDSLASGQRKLIKNVYMLFMKPRTNFLIAKEDDLSKKEQDHLYVYITSRLEGYAGLQVPLCQQLIKQTFESFSFNWAISSKRLITFILYSSVRTGGRKLPPSRRTYRIGLY